MGSGYGFGNRGKGARNINGFSFNGGRIGVLRTNSEELPISEHIHTHNTHQRGITEKLFVISVTVCLEGEEKKKEKKSIVHFHTKSLKITNKKAPLSLISSEYFLACRFSPLPYHPPAAPCFSRHHHHDLLCLVIPAHPCNQAIL